MTHILIIGDPANPRTCATCADFDPADATPNGLCINTFRPTGPDGGCDRHMTPAESDHAVDLMRVFVLPDTNPASAGLQEA